MNHNLLYKSTRSSADPVTASQAILTGLSPDGGLYVPTEVPSLPCSLEDMAQMSYQDLAYTIMSQFLTDFTEEELRHCIDSAYDSKFDTPSIAAIATCENGQRW